MKAASRNARGLLHLKHLAPLTSAYAAPEKGKVVGF